MTAGIQDVFLRRFGKSKVGMHPVIGNSLVRLAMHEQYKRGMRLHALRWVRLCS